MIMKETYMALGWIASLIILAGSFFLRKNTNPAKKVIRLLLWFSVLSFVMQGFSFEATEERWALIFNGFYYISSVFQMIVLVEFLQSYTTGLKKMPVVRYGMLVFGILNAVSMIVNIWTQHAFTCTWMEVPHWGECYATQINPVVAVAHLLFFAIAVSIILYALIRELVISLKMYRIKYGVILFFFLFVVFGNVANRIFGISVNLSPLFFLYTSFFIAYFTLYYVPKDIVTSLLVAAVGEIEGGIICYDNKGKCVFANQPAEVGFGREADDTTYEGYFLQVMNGRNADDVEYEQWVEHHEIDGENMVFNVSYNPLRDNMGHYIGSFIWFDNQTEAIKQMQKEHFRASHDPLTGAYNREHFFETVRELLDKEPDVEHCIVCSDIKDFKMVNELFGEEVGDSILKQEEAFLREMVTEESRYGRLSGDRFAVCLRTSSFDEAVFEQYMDKLTAIGSNSVYRMHVHAGVYIINDPTIEISVMCDRALMAVQYIKDDYERKFAYYDDSMGFAKQAEKTILSEFEEALEQEQFLLYLQPQISKDREVLGAEALVRWRHPAKGIIPPIQFVPLFEKTGYIHRLDRYVWERACRKLREWKDAGKENMYLSVNISPKDFYYINIYETLVELIEKYEINPGNLRIEITETALMTELNKQLSTLSKLREYGVQIEIDDFGSGYSSLNTLKDIEVDVLKLDMGFLSETSNVERSRTIVNHIISMSKNLGLAIISEGVETEDQIHYLTEAGCDMFQGYFFSRPVPVEEFEERYLNKD